TIDALLDAAPPGYRGRVMDAALKINGVIGVERTRIRRAGNRYFADLTVGLARNVTFQRSDQVVAEISAAVHCILPDADVVIHSGKKISRDAVLEQKLKAIMHEFPDILDMHDVEIKRVREKVYMSCHCTMPDDLPLSRVHDISTALEIRFKQTAPELFKVLIH